jgi:hypothetical protein
MDGLGPLQRGWSRLLSAWTRNDGKPREEWAPGVDLKEAVLIGLLVAVVAAMAFAVVSPLIEQLNGRG